MWKGIDHKDKYGLEKTGYCHPSDPESVSLVLGWDIGILWSSV